MENSIFTKVFDYFFDSKKRINSKVFLFFFIILSLNFTDNVFEISKNIHIKNKIEQIKKINEVLKDSVLLTSREIDKLTELRKSIINRKYYFDFSNSLSVFDKVNKNYTEQNYVKDKWYIGFAVSIPSLVLLIFFMNFLSGFFDKEFRQDLTLKVIILGLLVLFILIFSVYISYYLSLRIPIFFENHIWINYVLNLIIGILLLVPMALVGFIIEKIMNNENKK